MKGGRALTFLGISIVLHATLVLALGGFLVGPDRIIQPIEIALEQLVGEQPSGESANAPAPGPLSSEPVPAPSPAPTPPPAPVKRAVKPRPEPSRPFIAAQQAVEPATTTAAAAASETNRGRSTQADIVNGSQSGTENSLGKATAQGSSGGSGQQQNASVLQGWLAAVRARIEAAKRYPFAAEARSIQGRATVHFRLSPEGRLRGYPILAESSGFAILDRAALQAVQQANPFPPFPGPAEEMPEGPLSVDVHFRMR